MGNRHQSETRKTSSHSFAPPACGSRRGPSRLPTHQACSSPPPPRLHGPGAVEQSQTSDNKWGQARPHFCSMAIPYTDGTFHKIIQDRLHAHGVQWGHTGPHYAVWLSHILMRHSTRSYRINCVFGLAKHPKTRDVQWGSHVPIQQCGYLIYG